MTVHDGRASDGGDRRIVLDQPVLAQPVCERQLPCAVEHVAVAVGAPVVPLPVLAQTDTDPRVRHPGKAELRAAACRGDRRPGNGPFKVATTEHSNEQAVSLPWNTDL